MWEEYCVKDVIGYYKVTISFKIGLEKKKFHSSSVGGNYFKEEVSWRERALWETMRQSPYRPSRWVSVTADTDVRFLLLHRFLF